MKRLLPTIALLVSIASHSQSINIVPAPLSLETKKGTFALSKSTVIVANKSEQATVNFLNGYLKKHYGFELKQADKAAKNFISIVTPTFIRKPDNEEHYSLNVSSNEVSIQGDSKAGTFYGMQTLLQLLPVSNSKSSNAKFQIPNCTIDDQPRFAYRGMHLDVSRHFFPVSYVKQYIDYLALHKMNYFHWHLTDDQGWRIEIKKYPKLTSVGAWRDGTIIGRFPGTGNDNTKHGGFYTQEQIKEVVKYAADRQITILPEIEMPGHSMAVLAAYPEFSTTPDSTFKVAMTWGLNGVVNNVFAPTEKTFKFLEDVLSEVMPLFPGQMIHIGGDECSKIWWHKDSVTQQFMRKQGLKNEEELQSYFIQRIEKFVNSKGKTIIGWDEILEGGLAPNAAVMSWTGEQGGIHAAKQKHNVVMTPGGWCYFDHTQTKNEDSVTIGGFTPLEKVYNYEPVPASLSAEEGKYIMGAQANVWTEYMAYPSKVEYMIFPRMAALSEVLWSSKEKRNWKDFERRLPVQLSRYDLWKANYSNAYYDVTAEVFSSSWDNGDIDLKLKSKMPNGSIFLKQLKPAPKNGNPAITVDSTDVIKIENNNETALRYYACNNEKYCTPERTLNFSFNKATGKKITSTLPPSPSYPGNGGLFSLVNGLKSERGISSAEWCGWNKNDEVGFTIDLGKPTSFTQVALNVLDQKSSWIYPPNLIGIAISQDGINYEAVTDINTYDAEQKPLRRMAFGFAERNARFVKVVLRPLSKIPEGSPGAGKTAWLFLDEVEVN